MKATSVFICSHCGAQFQKWTGRCLECGQWGTVAEEAILKEPTAPSRASTASYAPAETVTLSEIQKKPALRKPTGIHELDRVLGGGIVPGSLILLGGEPGIGKSTLALELAGVVAGTLYVSGEESVEQIKLRADRLAREQKERARGLEKLVLANETIIERIIRTIEETKPMLTIIDSMQTMVSGEVQGEMGSPTQIRASAAKLLEAAKRIGTTIVIIGHVTKEGVVAGPKTLEHLVDTVLYFEGERHHSYRILRTVKNRFGPTDEVGIFDMTEAGLIEVPNASAALLDDRSEPMPGSIITCLLEGTRPMLVEIQALVNKTAFGYPVRKSSGVDLNRLHVLVAVLQKRAGLNLAQYDIHVNVVGGLSADEPAADLAVCLAIASSYKDKALGKDLVVFGEVGLGGEVRSVRSSEKRLKECETLGFKRVIAAKLKKKPALASRLHLIEVADITELIQQT